MEPREPSSCKNVLHIMKKWSALTWLLLCTLFFVISSAGPKACPPRKPGLVQNACQCVNCSVGEFCSQMNGHAVCKKCTPSCTARKNQVEITACSKTTDRRCQCKAGFYCPSPVSLTCRRDCQPCANGFTRTANLNISCQPYTDCARLGMAVINVGSPTTDHVCGHQPRQTSEIVMTGPVHRTDMLLKSKALYTASKRHTTNAPYTPDTPTQRLPSSIHKHHSIQSETTAASGQRDEFAQTEREGPVSPSEPLSKTTWILLLLLVLALCLVLCLFLQCKNRAIKTKLELAGRAFGKYHPVISTAEPDASNLTDAVGEARGQGSFPGKNQQVTMEHVGNADGINNTVGSIFIYSPGTVILGSNANDRKEETETNGGDGREDVCLVSVPQQESSSEKDIRMATQDELGKELSIPVPATSK